MLSSSWDLLGSVQWTSPRAWGLRRHRHINGGRTNLWPSDAAFMPLRSHPAIAPSPRRGTVGVNGGRSDGVACRRRCKWRRGWTEIVALIRAT